MQRFVLFGLSVLLAVWVGYAAALTWSRSAVGAHGVPLLGSDPVNRLRATDSYLDAPDEFERHAGEVRRVSQAVLRAGPLNTAALRQLALVEALDAGVDDPAASTRLIRLAGRVSRRDLANELLLIEDAVARERVPEALAHYDHALAVHPGAGTRLFPVLSAAIEEPSIRTVLGGYVNRAWYRTFLRNALSQGASPEAVTDLVLDMRGKVEAEIYNGLIGTILHQALARGSYETARRLAGSLPKIVPETIDSIEFTVATSDPRLGSLGWNLAQTEGVTTRLAGENGLVVEIAPDHTERAAERMTLLKPGTYQVMQQVTYPADSAHAALSWQVTCVRPEGEQVIWQDDGGGTAREEDELVIPAKCEAQRWRLSVTAAEGNVPSSARLLRFAVKAR